MNQIFKCENQEFEFDMGIFKMKLREPSVRESLAFEKSLMAMDETDVDKILDLYGDYFVLLGAEKDCCEKMSFRQLQYVLESLRGKKN